MPPLLPFQKQHEQTTRGVYLETDGVHPLNAVPAGELHIDTNRCTGCGRCVAACPWRLFTLDQAGFRKTATVRSEGLCAYCSKCIDNCPVGAISKISPESTPHE